jgi:hypothetical protein
VDPLAGALFSVVGLALSYLAVPRDTPTKKAAAHQSVPVSRRASHASTGSLMPPLARDGAPARVAKQGLTIYGRVVTPSAWTASTVRSF